MFELSAGASRVLQALEAAGFEAWVVGGWVRDALRGDASHDVDVTTNALWQEVAAAARAAGLTVHETGTTHGTVTVVADGEPVEVTTYRVEGTYSDLRHPDEVRFVRDVREDLARRDFTVNAMAWHPERGLLDPFGGREDLAAGVIRAVGVPEERFAEDALRVLRAVRFACRMGFDVEPATHAALVAAAPNLKAIAQERIGQEVGGILASHRGGWALMHETDALVAAIPELAPMVGFDQRSRYHAYDVLEHTARVMNGTEQMCGMVTPPELAWAALLHDVAKPDCFTLGPDGRGHFYGHPYVGAEKAEDIMRRLAIPLDVVRPAVTLVRYHDRMVSTKPRSIRKILATLERENPGRASQLAFMLLNLKRADAMAKAPAYVSYALEVDEVERALRKELRAKPAIRVRDLAVGGADVMECMDIPAGPEVGIVLKEVLRQVMAGSVVNEREALRAGLADGRFRYWD